MSALELKNHLKFLHGALYKHKRNHTFSSGPSGSKLNTSLVNNSLKFTSSDTQIY